MKIYEIDEKIRELMSASIDEDGVIDEDKMLEVQQLSIDKEQKILGFAKFIAEKKAEIESMKAAEKRIRDRRKSIENMCARNEEYLLSLVDGKVSDAEVSVSKRRSERLIVDEDTISGNIDFIKERIVRTIDKIGLKSAIKNGADIKGAHIEEHYSLQIK